MMSGAISNEDDWYDTDKWESFSKSKARMMNPREASDQRQQDEWTTASDSNQPPKSGLDDVEWIRLVGCDICLPKDRRKKIDGDVRFRGIIHFIGGVFVGTIPGQAYGQFLEGLTSRGRFITIATPCPSLSGMDHLKAAYEASLKFRSACDALEVELGTDTLRAQDLPHIGVGHSLGSKVHVVLNSIPDCRRAAGRRRSANVLIAFNNFGVNQSVPALRELADAQRALQQGAAAAAPVLSQLASTFKGLADIPAFKDMIANTGRNAEGEATMAAVADLLGKMGAAAERVGSAGQGAALEEFSPSPAETQRLLDSEYAVGRNLVVKFLDDTIDQSVPLCQSLRARFTAPDTGRGGALSLRRLPGSHVTPNTPRFDAASLQGPLEGVARAKAAELEALCDLVATFAAEEAARAALLPPEESDTIRLGPHAAAAPPSPSPAA